MSEPLAFEKWQGLGNDFVIVSARSLTDTQVQALCDRRLGIGADGVLLIEGGALPRMIVRNADGSRPEMCGNGLRCVAGCLAERAPSGFDHVVVATDAGERPCVLRRLGPGSFEVEVEMGVARIGPDLAIAHDGRSHAFSSIDMGNPHAVTFERFSDAERDRLAPEVERAPASGTNVEFCAVSDAGGETVIDLVVWERGVGYTRACGTGACAAAVAGCQRGLIPFGAAVRVRLPGGVLTIVVDRATLAVRMTGPAHRAFSGLVELE